ncbi:MAG: 5-formyltetrahydrofolate cyclo-ligase [Pseudomonadota bacterium]
MQEKIAARADAFARRKAARAALGAAPDAATEALLSLLRRTGARRIAGYLPIRTEIDPRPAMASLLAEGATLAVPMVEGPARPLAFRRWTPDAPLVEGAFGVMIPEATEPVVPEALIVPLAAFDAAGYRLGYGGGFYDRTLAVLRPAGPVAAIGFAYAAQGVLALPRETTDAPLDALATEAGATVFSQRVLDGAARPG